ncbi:MAG: hypothetical protein HY231_13865 [Acidobacteria bacterium]|nr:hypothetical protein [Acidobacteriota bacterium]
MDIAGIEKEIEPVREKVAEYAKLRQLLEASYGQKILNARELARLNRLMRELYQAAKPEAWQAVRAQRSELRRETRQLEKTIQSCRRQLQIKGFEIQALRKKAS